jgi:Fe-S cluster biogenesis protein NfuA
VSFLSRLFGGATRPAPEGDAVRVAAVEATLERLRPMLRADGGDVWLIAVRENGAVDLSWRGACASCAVQTDTLTLGLEPALRNDHDWIQAVHMVPA